MIGGLLFRYWEGGTAARSGNPNVYINWAQKKRPAQQPSAPKATELEQAVLVPLPVLCLTGRVIAAGPSPVAFARQANATAAASTIALVSLPARATLPDALLASAALPDALPMTAVPPDVRPEMDAESHRRLAVIEHNRRAIAAIAAAMLADDI